MVKEFKEKEITISFIKAFNKPTTKRAKSTLKILKDKVRKETREDIIKINNSVNQALWERGMFKAQRKIKLKIVKEKNGVRVYLPEDKIIETKKEKKEDNKKTENTLENKEVNETKENTEVKEQTKKQTETKKENK